MRLLPCCLAIGLALLSANLATGGAGDQRLDIYWVDVEGGAATLLVTPTGETVLIDTGNPGRRDAQRIFDVAVRVAGIKQIDHLVITHYHGDHYGGAATLAELLPIHNVYDNGEFPGGRERPDRRYLEFNAQRRLMIQPGEQIPLRQGDAAGGVPLWLRCLAARQEFIAPGGDEPPNPLCSEARRKDRDISDNANSIVLLLGMGSFRFFDGGDLTWNMEERLVCPVNLVGEVDVYQVTHHGLDVSNNPILVRSLRPRVAIMNNGVTKGCQPDTFKTLKECPSIEAIYQLHKNLREDAENNTAPEYIANHERQCQANYVKLSVAADGQSYTVAIPATNHERTYRTKER